MIRDDYWVQEQLGDLYVPSPLTDYPADRAQARGFNRVERAVARWPLLLAGVVWDPARSRIIIKATPAGMERAQRIATRLAEAGVAEEIVIEKARLSAAGLHTLHMRVIEDHWGWLGGHAPSVTGSQDDVRINGVIVDVEEPLSEEMIETTRLRWGSEVRLRFAPGSRMIAQ